MIMSAMSQPNKARWLPVERLIFPVNPILKGSQRNMKAIVLENGLNNQTLRSEKVCCDR